MKYRETVNLINSFPSQHAERGAMRADWRLLGSTLDSTQRDLEKSRIGPSSLQLFEW